MTPSVLVLNLALGFAAMTALCLSMNRHATTVFLVKLPRRAAIALRVAGWTGIALSLAIAVLVDGWNFGPVQWLGALTAASLLVVACLSYRPGWLRPAALAAVPLALVGALVL